MSSFSEMRAKPVGPQGEVPEQDMYWEFVSRLSDEDYLGLMVRSIDEVEIDGVRMPGFPSLEVQRQFNGLAGEHALRGAYNFYRILKDDCNRFGMPIGPNTQVLDFGCGWGRIARFFFKDVRGGNLYGVDVDPEIITFCRTAMPCGTYSVVEPRPPTSFSPESLDVIFAHSVFSHLAEPVALAWIAEFSRVLRPGGLVLATTERRSFLDLCESLQAKGPPFESLWHEALARSFVPVENARRAYDKGKFLFAPTGGGAHRDRSFYGEALIPPQYVERIYGKYLTARDWYDEPSALSQALFVLQKPLKGSTSGESHG